MSKTQITRDDPDFGHLVPPGTDSVYLVDGEDRIEVGAVLDPSGQAPTVIKSLRLSQDIVDAIYAAGHPEGFTGIVREALAEWMERHQGQQSEIRDARQAVAVLNRLVDRLSAVEAA